MLYFPRERKRKRKKERERERKREKKGGERKYKEMIGKRETYIERKDLVDWKEN